ncbi:MAG: hypothetical protein HUU54_13455 [Ignavibacteriaceae bacterium]|nr:hypothetical protein [Ignavibacteriaceae bacterium]
MSKVVFAVQYEIEAAKRDVYLAALPELKSLISAEGLESYGVYEIKGKPNNFEEIFIFSSYEAYDAYDDAENERLSVLISKIESLKVNNTSKYNVLTEVTSG